MTCANDKNASIWQLQGPNMQKVSDLPHNAFVVSATELHSKDADNLLTMTMQGFIFIWNLGFNPSAQHELPQPTSHYKLDCNGSALSFSTLLDYDY